MDYWIEQYWAMVPGLVLLVAAAYFQWTTQRVPNLMTYGFLVGAWLLGTASSVGAVPLAGGIGSSLAGFAAGLGLLLPIYLSGWLGAGCVKAQAAFGAWVGCAMPAMLAFQVVFATTIVGALVTSIGYWIAFTRLSREEGQTYLFPAQVTLSTGSLIGLCLFLMRL